VKYSPTPTVAARRRNRAENPPPVWDSPKTRVRRGLSADSQESDEIGLRISYRPHRSSIRDGVKAAHVLIAVAWLVAAVGVSRTFGGRALNLGFVAALILTVAAGATDWRALKSLPNRMPLQALGFEALAFVAPAALCRLGLRAWLSAGRACAALAWLAVFIAFDGETVRSVVIRCIRASDWQSRRCSGKSVGARELECL
jgi:hypothetical protein